MLKKIVICPDCKGTGVKTWEELTDYHKSTYITKSKKCSVCDGSGRLLEITTTKYEKIKS